jgi:GntR family transcriptional regulator
MKATENNLTRINPVRETTLLPRLVVEQIRNMIQVGELSYGSQLPSEPELASSLKVSRSTLRAALSYLENEGSIIRRRGVGTFVADRPSLSNKLNINWGVTQIIMSTGATPGIAEMNFDIQSASQRMVEHLRIQPSDRILQIERVRTADLKPVSISIDHIPLERLKSLGGAEDYLERFRTFLEERQSIYLFFKEVLLLEMGYATAWLRPMVADAGMAKSLEIPLHSPILCIEQLDYDVEGNPLLLTDEYFAANAFIFSVHRSP